MSHPSLLQLDRFALGQEEPSLAAHLEECTVCAAHVGRCQQPVPVPAWVREIKQPRKPLWLRWIALGTLATAALAIAVLPRGNYEVTAKGTPSLAVYLRRGERISLWDGVQPLQPGDAVQLKLQAAGFARVTVGSIDGGEVHSLYEGATSPNAATLLPDAFTLDASARDESLLVVFSQRPVTLEELRAARAGQPRDARLWTTVLDLTKGGGAR